MKNTWLIIKDTLNKENNKSKFPLQFVHTFNKYTNTIAYTLANDSMPSRLHNDKYKEYLKTPTNECFSFNNIIFQEVIKIIDQFKNKISSGVDGISN